MSLADDFAGMFLELSAALGGDGPFHDAVARWPGAAVREGGSIVTPGTPIEKACSVQVDKVTERMRNIAGYTDKDVALFVLAATLDGSMDTDAKVEVTEGPHAGTYAVDWVDRDPVAIYWECRGRLV